MNDVETKHELRLDEIRNNSLYSLTNGNNTSENNDTSVLTTEIPTTISPSSTSTHPNLTVIDAMVKTAIAMQNITSSYEQYNHEYYIYIWAVAILGCILLTTERLVTKYQ